MNVPFSDALEEEKISVLFSHSNCSPLRSTVLPSESGHVLEYAVLCCIDESQGTNLCVFLTGL